MANANLKGASNAPHLNETDARQGARGLHILGMLIVSIALAAIVLALVWGHRAHDLAVVDQNPPNHAASASQSTQQASPTQPASPPAGQP